MKTKTTMHFKTIPLLIIFIHISISVFGQKAFEKGYVVNPENDTIFGKIKDRKPEPFADLYKKIRFKKEGSFFVKKYKPSQIIGYKAGDRVYESIGIETEGRLLNTRYFISSTSRKSFLKVVHKGNLNYYHWEYIDNESGFVDYIPLFHKEKSTEMVRATQGIFGLKKKLLSQYFSDCPELVREIDKKEVRTVQDVLELHESLCE